ncbi:efflux RND transporter periplasmic adaptor subunit [Hydrogenophaga sp.]|uniref:efflux RND transporter periplasmic adaptor subunit n=1 Tax=Hydrogenophaga sp. TaxID=1904254 RepID=UPI00286D9CFE|nr:efflux RND transporter periplasmic adaptor subunit [Hydrogenophaga sp.]
MTPRPRLLTAACLLALPLQGTAASFDCLLEPSQTVEIRSAVEGLIHRIHVQRGDDVKAGQAVVELDTALERSALAVARFRATAEGRLVASKNRMDYAQRKTKRSDELHGGNFLSAQARDEAETERKLAEAEHKEALENQELARLELKRSMDLLNQKTLRSPFNGVVVERMLNPGDLAEAGNGRKPILKLARMDPLHVEVVLPLATFGKLKQGTSARVKTEAGQAYDAKVKVVDRVFDAASGTYGVQLELPNPNGKIPAGLRCQVDFPGIANLATAQRP